MNVLIDLSSKVVELNSMEYDSERDDKDLLKLYKALWDIASQKQQQEFEAVSHETMELIKTGNLTDQKEKEWLRYVFNLFGIVMAEKIYSDTKVVSIKDVDQIIDYYEYGCIQDDIASFGFYACAQLLRDARPMVCYELTKMAFMKNPDLAHILGVKYRYEGKAAEEHITEECPFCGSRGEELVPFFCSPQVLKLENDRIFPPSKLWIKCNCCKNYFTYNFPLTDTGKINGHYTKNTDNLSLKVTYNLDCYNHIFNRLEELASGKDYLEIGIGNGEMLAVAQEFGYHVDAVEICKEDCEKVSAVLNIDIKWCDIIDFETEKKYDVIVMGDVFEHVIRPVQVLKKLPLC